MYNCVTYGYSMLDVKVSCAHASVQFVTHLVQNPYGW